MKYITCEEARPLPGLRLALSGGGPGPWGEAAKSVMYVRHVPYIAVMQETLGQNEELFAWTGQRDAPVAMYNDEKPRHSWLDILYLAERLGHGLSLLPENREEQVQCVGISHQICGQDGLGWNRRLSIFHNLVAADGDQSKTILPPRVFKDYNGTPEAMAAGEGRLIDILTMLHTWIERQRIAGSRYLVGNRLSAADIYFATFLGMVEPLSIELNPMPEFLRTFYSSGSPALRQAITLTLTEHRDFIYRTHLQLPLDY